MMLDVQEQDKVLRIKLSRPEVRNAFNDALIRELTQAFSEVPDHIRVVVLEGEGKVFCAGADIDWMRRSKDYSHDDNIADAMALQKMFTVINELPQVVVGKVHGAAVGGGIGLVSACDIVVADEHAKFGFTEAKLGLISAVISPFVLPKIGSAASRRYFLTGEIFSALSAQEMGLVHEVVPMELLEDKAQEFCQLVLNNGPNAVAESKRLIRDVLGTEVSVVDAHETAKWIATIRRSDEGQEGLSAFLDKRNAKWACES